MKQGIPRLCNCRNLKKIIAEILFFPFFTKNANCGRV